MNRGLCGEGGKVCVLGVSIKCMKEHSRECQGWERLGALE